MTKTVMDNDDDDNDDADDDDKGLPGNTISGP